MQSFECSQHLLKCPPDVITYQGKTYVICECVKCGLRMAFRLDSKGELDAVAMVGAEQKAA